MTDTILVEINSEIYEKASQKVENINEFIEQQLRLLLDDDFSDEYDLLVELTEKMNEIKVLETRLAKLRENRIGNVVDTDVFNESMVVITRIHDNLGMIGKNQIKSIAKRNNVPYDSLLEHIRKKGYTVVNFTGVQR